jgi:hypothetical protein
MKDDGDSKDMADALAISKQPLDGDKDASNEIK